MMSQRFFFEQAKKSIQIKQLIYPWVIWFMGSLFFFYKYLVQVSPSVMTEDLMSAFQVNGAGLGNLSAFYFYAYLVMQIPVGIIIDKFSPRLVTTLAIFLCSVATLLFAMSSNLWFACLSRALIGFGAAFAAVSCFKMATLWFPPKRFALVSGLYMTSAMLGGIGGQMPLSMLVDTVSWRPTLIIIGSIGIVLSLLYYSFVRDKLLHTTNLKASNDKKNKDIFTDFLIILRNPQAWLLSLYSGLAFMPVSVFGGLWGVPFLVTHYHLGRNVAALAVSGVFLGFAFGAPFWGWLSDYTKKRLPILIFAPLVGLLMLAIVIYASHLNPLQLNILLVLFGFGASGFFTCFAMIRELFPLWLVATVLGLMNTFDSLCEAIFEPVVGSILDSTWEGAVINGAHQFSSYGYQLALSLLPLSMIAALFCLIWVKDTYCLTYEERLADSYQESPLQPATDNAF